MPGPRPPTAEGGPLDGLGPCVVALRHAQSVLVEDDVLDGTRRTMVPSTGRASGPVGLVPVTEGPGVAEGLPGPLEALPGRDTGVVTTAVRAHGAHDVGPVEDTGPVPPGRGVPLSSPPKTPRGEYSVCGTP